MKLTWNTPALPLGNGRAPRRRELLAWLCAGLLFAGLGLLAGPMGEAARSPLNLLTARQAPATTGSLDAVLSEVIRLTRQRRALVALMATGTDSAAGELAPLDARLQNTMETLRRRTDVLPASIAQDMDVLYRDWKALESASPGPEENPSTLFARHSQFIDHQLVTLSHVRDAGV